MAGASAYWMPDILLHWLFGYPILLLSLLAPALALLLYRYESKRIGGASLLLPISMLLGIWMIGPVAIAVSVQSHGGTFLSPTSITDFIRLWAIFPASTFIMSTYSGSLGGVALITLALLLIAVIQAKRIVASNKAL